MSCLTLQNVNKSFGNNQVIKNFSYEFPTNGIVSIMGKSGCGKTTLLRLIAGLEKLSSGKIIKPENATIAYVFQEPRLFPQITAIENVACCGKPGLSEKCLDDVFLADYKNYLPSELSGGMQQRVSIARALAANADILLLDEAFRSQDENMRDHLYGIIQEYAKEHLVISVTHDSIEAKKFSDNIIFMIA